MGKDIAQKVAPRETANPAHLATVPGYPLIEVAYVPGVVLLARRGLFETIGLLDEQYFFSGEIADFGKRARDKGYRLCVDLDVHATHNVRVTRQELRGKARAFLLALTHAATDRFGNQNDSFIVDPPVATSTRRQA